MKIFRSFFLAVCLVLSAAGAAFASPSAPTDQEVITAFQNAVTVFEWFEHQPLPTDGNDKKDSGYMIYYSVSDTNIRTMAQLKRNASLFQFLRRGRSPFVPGLRWFCHVPDPA